MKLAKMILGIVLFVVGALWLIPTIFVESAPYTVLSVKETEEEHFEVTYTYYKQKEHKSATYIDSVEPMVGSLGKCYYFTCPPYSVHRGDPPSPVPPLCCILAGIILPYLNKSVLKIFKIFGIFGRKKKKVKNEITTEEAKEQADE